MFSWGQTYDERWELPAHLAISEQKERLRLGITKGKAVMRRRTRFKGEELSCGDHYGLFLPQSFRWYSALPVGMFYARRVNAGKLIFPIDTIF